MPPLKRLYPAQDLFTLYVFVSVLFIVGVVFGVMMYNALTLEQQQQVTSEVGRYADLFRAGIVGDPEDTLRERALFHTKWVVLIWLLGVTVVGMPFILALDFLKGVLIGFSVGAMIREYAWQGLLFAFASIAPPNLLVIPALIMASVAGIAFSLHVVKNRLLQSGGELAHPLLSHTAVCLFMLLALWGAALLEAYLSPYLIRLAAPVLGAAAGGL
ncbi:stage II sporulation protein M [Paenibacillus darwinianus]|uniref:Stage II sporulation protein M n=1 Tax=Paenibacillus darwinianus TaxID=1380763 RepID=A0A9W5S0J3_9BACL|nr:stage II sporulation protein M [Paenibacillus darwinianus]EXX88274.1 stage II sporulation protein M [Paenibacillus darwinianus]EXX88611.1 stage II sporulation protein M [Paenibacillus darwinianus]EXX91746.1 stage II sporulation protein M [Paenibacillus darwinianus]